MTTSFIEDIHRPQIPKCSLECSSNEHHQMYPKYPWKTIMVFFQHSASLGNNIGLFKPKARHTSLHRWPHQKHSEDKVWTSRGKFFGQIYWNGILHQIIIYINLHISFAFGIISLQWHISNYILWVLYHCILHVWYSVYFIYIFHILYQLSHMMIYYIHEV